MTPALFTWLWQELERRYGSGDAADIKAAFLARQRQYQQSLRIQQFKRDLHWMRAKYQAQPSESLVKRIRYREQAIGDYERAKEELYDEA